MKKSLFSKLAIMLMAICFCSNVWADEIITLKFTVRDEGGFYLKNTFVSAVSDTPDKCEISNPTGFVDDQCYKRNAGNTKGVRNFPDYSHIQLHGCYSNQSNVIITVLEDPGNPAQWLNTNKPQISYHFTVTMPIPANFKSSSVFQDGSFALSKLFMKKE